MERLFDRSGRDSFAFLYYVSGILNVVFTSLQTEVLIGPYVSLLNEIRVIVVGFEGWVA